MPHLPDLPAIGVIPGNLGRLQKGIHSPSGQDHTWEDRLCPPRKAAPVSRSERLFPAASGTKLTEREPGQRKEQEWESRGARAPGTEHRQAVSTASTSARGASCPWKLATTASRNTSGAKRSSFRG